MCAVIAGFIIINPMFDNTKVIKDTWASIGCFLIMAGSIICTVVIMLYTEQQYNSKNYILKVETYQEYHNNVIENTDTLYVIIPKSSSNKK